MALVSHLAGSVRLRTAAPILHQMKLMRRTAATQAAGDAVFTARCHHGYPAAWQCKRTETVPLLFLSTGPSPVHLPDGWSATAVAQLGGRTAALCPEHSPRPAAVDRSGYIEAPHRHAPDGRPTVFLAGGIQSCEDWQSQARTVLADVPGLVVLNPRRADFPLGNPDAEAEQVAWESEHLRIAGHRGPGGDRLPQARPDHRRRGLLAAPVGRRLDGLRG